MVNLQEAKMQLSKLVELAESGQDVVIARAGKPVARLTRLETTKRPIHYGALKGRVRISPDFEGLRSTSIQSTCFL
jgi:prevent-host-death family protein